MQNLESIKKLIQEKRLEEAQQLLLALHKENSASAESYYLLGMILHARNLLPDAVDAFQESLKINSDYMDSAISLSIIYNDTGHYSEGKRLFQQAERTLALKPQIATHSMQLNTALAKHHLDTGKLYRKIKRYEEAATEFYKAASLDPENIEAHTNLIHTMADRGQIILAHAELQKLIQKFPRHSELRVQLALLHFRNGNFVDGQMELQQAVRQDPENQQAQMYLSMASTASESTL